MLSACLQVVFTYALGLLAGRGGGRDGGRVDGALSEKLPCVRLRVRARPSSQARERTEPAPLPRGEPLTAVTHLLHFTQLSPRQRHKNTMPRGSRYSVIFIPGDTLGASLFFRGPFNRL